MEFKGSDFAVQTKLDETDRGLRFYEDVYYFQFLLQRPIIPAITQVRQGPQSFPMKNFWGFLLREFNVANDLHVTQRLCHSTKGSFDGDLSPFRYQNVSNLDIITAKDTLKNNHTNNINMT